jgi:hypothetical protein
MAPADLAPYPFKARQHGDEVVRFFGIIHSSGLRCGPHLTVDAECQARMPSVVPASGIPRYDFAGRSPSPVRLSNKPDHGSWFPVASNYLCALPEKHTHAVFAIIF